MYFRYNLWWSTCIGHIVYTLCWLESVENWGCELPLDYDGIVDRKNDIIFHDRTEFDENVAVLASDFVTFAQAMVDLAKKSGASKEALQKILNTKSKGVSFMTRRQSRFEDFLKGRVDVDFVARLERKNDFHTISNKTFDFTKKTIQQLIQDGYEETKEQMKHVLTQVESSTS